MSVEQPENVVAASIREALQRADSDVNWAICERESALKNLSKAVARLEALHRQRQALIEHLAQNGWLTAADMEPRSDEAPF